MRTFFKKSYFFWAKTLLPWVGATVVLAWLFKIYPINQIFNSIRLANPWGVGGLAIGYFYFIWRLDTFGVGYTISRLVGHRIPWREILPIRAATYPLSLLNYGAGQAAFAYTLQRRYRIPAGDLIGFFTLLTAADFFWVITLAFIGSFMGEHRVLGVDLTPTVRLISGATYAFTAAHLLFWCLHWENRVRGAAWQRAFQWLRAKRLFRVFHEATLADYLRLGLLRLPIPFTMTVVLYFVAHLFHAHVSLTAILGNVPIAALIGIIPISWGGVGTSNKALVDLLTPHLLLSPDITASVSVESLILAMSLVWMFANYLLKLGVGLWYLPRLQRMASIPASSENVKTLDIEAS